MGFSEKQVSELRRNLNSSCVRSREVQGRTLSYIEGWHAIAEANRIFGFDSLGPRDGREQVRPVS